MITPLVMVLCALWAIPCIPLPVQCTARFGAPLVPDKMLDGSTSNARAVARSFAGRCAASLNALIEAETIQKQIKPFESVKDSALLNEKQQSNSGGKEGMKRRPWQPKDRGWPRLLGA